jgi:hypothetical protein
MLSIRLRRAAIAYLLGLLGVSAGCGSSPSVLGPLTELGAVASPAPLSPARGLTGDVVQVFGQGFLPGASVTFDGLVASIIRLTSTTITVTIPSHSPGTVDVKVTNPDGTKVTLTGAFTYESVSLTASPDVVGTGGQITVTWVAPSGRGCVGGGDWIALYKVGDPDKTGAANGHSDLWYDHVCGAVTGRSTLTAPNQPADYEFRFMVGDIAVARSNPVAVSGD